MFNRLAIIVVAIVAVYFCEASPRPASATPLLTTKQPAIPLDPSLPANRSHFEPDMTPQLNTRARMTEPLNRYHYTSTGTAGASIDGLHGTTGMFAHLAAYVNLYASTPNTFLNETVRMPAPHYPVSAQIIYSSGLQSSIFKVLTVSSLLKPWTLPSPMHTSWLRKVQRQN